MGNMEKIDLAQLNNALTAPEASLRKSLSIADSSILIALMEGLARRYPAQDLEGSIEEFHADFEALAVKHGIGKVQKAVEALRIDPKQDFFPKPNEIAREIERQRLAAMPAHIYARQ